MDKIILLAEDSPDDTVAFKRVLREAGLLNPIVEVRTGDEVIAYLEGKGAFADRKKNPYPTALFLDLVIPRVDGWEVLKWLKTHHALNSMLIVVLTWFAQSRTPQDAHLAGADCFLRKPFERDELSGLIAGWPDVWEFDPQDPRAFRLRQKDRDPEPRV